MPFTPEESARYEQLSTHLTLREQSNGLSPIRLHWGDPKPPEATAPDGMISPPAGLSGDPTPHEATAPEPEPAPEDADADVDAELADLLAQLQRRLGR